jgi:CBS domain containing-hemolysin-like protein
VGNLIPSTIGSSYADALAPMLAGMIRLLMLLLAPLVWLVTGLSKMISGLFGGDSIGITVTEEEIMTLVDAGQKEGTIDDEEKAMIFSVLQFGETLVREVMIPRIDIVALEINTPLDAALDRFLETGHSRIPIYMERIDNIEGLLYAKDLLAALRNSSPASHSIRDLMRQAYFVPESKRADLALKEMQKSTIHMAIVVDEYGGTAGIVTIENLIEEIIGDIQDEYDVEEESEYLQLSENEFSIDASMDLHDINELLEISLPTDDHDTLAGYIYSRLGRVPTLGETLEDHEHKLLIRIDAVEGRRIRKVQVTRLHENGEPEPTPTDALDDVAEVSDKPQ